MLSKLVLVEKNRKVVFLIGRLDLLTKILNFLGSGEMTVMTNIKTYV